MWPIRRLTASIARPASSPPPTSCTGPRETQNQRTDRISAATGIALRQPSRTSAQPLGGQAREHAAEPAEHVPQDGGGDQTEPGEQDLTGPEDPRQEHRQHRDEADALPAGPPGALVADVGQQGEFLLHERHTP
jgi:hypothetical protein